MVVLFRWSSKVFKHQITSFDQNTEDKPIEKTFNFEDKKEWKLKRSSGHKSSTISASSIQQKTHKKYNTHLKYQVMLELRILVNHI